MTITDFLIAPHNLPFLLALWAFLLIAFLELFGISAVIDVEWGMEGPDYQSPGVLGRFCSWLRVGEVPLLVLLVVGLFLFGVSGYLSQQLFLSTFGGMLPAGSAAVLATLITLPLMRGTTRVLAKILPKEESDAVSLESLVGRRGRITLGTARKGFPSQARVKDHFGRVHYVMVEPLESEEEFGNGEEVVLSKHDGATFFITH